MYGPDPASNPRLATLVNAAKKAGLPKVTMESAIARGAGKSLSGASLEPVTIEAMVPPSVAAIIECQTDNRLRTLADVRLIIKNFGGTVSPTSHLFERRGKVIFNKSESVNEGDIFDRVIDASATDFEFEDDGRVLVVYTDPQQTSSAVEALANVDGLRHESSEIIWHPNSETLVQDASTEVLADFVGKDDSIYYL